MVLTKTISVTPTEKSRLPEVDFDNLTFGEIFTDHMFACDFKNGQWQKPEVVPYKEILLSPASSALHYGQAVFEGMKAYKDDAGGVWLFRPELNFERINISCSRLGMPEFPKNYFFEGMKPSWNWMRVGYNPAWATHSTFVLLLLLVKHVSKQLPPMNINS